MDNTDILNNRIAEFAIIVPDNYEFEKHKNILKNSVEKSLNYLQTMLFDKLYLKEYIYKVDEYYPISNTVIVKRILNNENNINEIFIVNKNSKTV